MKFAGEGQGVAAKGRRNFLRLHLLPRKVHETSRETSQQSPPNFPTSTQMKLLAVKKVVKARWGLQYVEVQADLQRFKLDWERVHD